MLLSTYIVLEGICIGFVFWVVECAIYFPTLQIIGALLLFDHRRYAGKRPEHVLYSADRACNVVWILAPINADVHLIDIAFQVSGDLALINLLDLFFKDHVLIGGIDPAVPVFEHLAQRLRLRVE